MIWFLFLAGGVFALLAAWRNWDWFFLHRTTRFLAAALGRTGARITYSALGALLVLIGLFLGASNDWALSHRTGFYFSVTASLPGTDAPTVADAVAGPLDAQLNHLPGVEQIVSESRGDGSYHSHILFSPKIEISHVQLEVPAAINAAYSFLPRTVPLGNVTSKLEPPQDRDAKTVAIAVVSKDADADTATLTALSRALLKNLVEQRALLNPTPLDDQLSNAGAPPALIVRVNRHPAIRITASAPGGKSASKAATRCAELAASELSRHPNSGTFEIINLTSQ